MPSPAPSNFDDIYRVPAAPFDASPVPPTTATPIPGVVSTVPPPPGALPVDPHIAQQRRSMLPWLAGALALVLVVVAGLVAQRFLTGQPANTATPATAPPPTVTVVVTPTVPATGSSSTTTSQPPATAPASTTPSSGLTDAQALTELAALAAQGQAQVDAASAAHVMAAQLSSKYSGVIDPLQTTASGSHTFGAVDILAEHRALVPRASGGTVVLADSRTFGSRKVAPNGDAYWRTLVFSPNFTDAASVKSWCASAFPELTGAALTNQCIPVQL